MFMDWQRQNSENDYPTESNLQIQCHPHQNNEQPLKYQPNKCKQNLKRLLNNYFGNWICSAQESCTEHGGSSL
jgi:hypothetical protein